jgi:membrane protease YdiL (CAAX protease family)
MVHRKTFFILGLITLFGFGALGVLLVEVLQDRSALALLRGEQPIGHQLARGALYGLIAVGTILWFIEMPFLRTPKLYFKELITEAGLKWPDLVFLSLAAGIGEEMLFRAGIQPYTGVWLTALIFVAVHGYLNPFNWRMSMYGVLMVIVSGGLGYLFDYVGLLAAMTAHVTIDLVLFFRFRYINR